MSDRSLSPRGDPVGECPGDDPDGEWLSFALMAAGEFCEPIPRGYRVRSVSALRMGLLTSSDLFIGDGLQYGLAPWVGLAKLV